MSSWAKEGGMRAGSRVRVGFESQALRSMATELSSDITVSLFNSNGTLDSEIETEEE